RERPGRRMADVAVAAEAEPVVEGLLGGVLFGLEAREDGPCEREDPEEPDDPGERSEADDPGPVLPDAEPRPAPPLAAHARSSSLNRLESRRSASVAMMIEKITTTIA